MKNKIAALLSAIVVLFATFGIYSTNQTASAVEAPVVFMGAGDIAACGSWSNPNAVSTGDLIRETNPDFVFAAGDNAYSDGTLTEYNQCYDPAWGSFKAKTWPVPGNHEYHTTGAQGYVDYFGLAKVSNTQNGGLYYAKDLGNNWRYYALNSEVTLSTGSAQQTWLANDLAAHPGMHYIAAWHRPRYNNGTTHGSSTSTCPLWNTLQNAKADLVIVGHEHIYNRYEKMDCNGVPKADGIREILIGNGGNQLYGINSSATPVPTYQNNLDFGDLKLNLYSDHYEWQFIASGRQWNSSNGGFNSGNKGQILDSGSTLTNIAGTPGTSTPTPTPTPTATATPTPTPTATSTPAPTGTLDRSVSAATDDAEQNVSSGAVDTASTDLEFTLDGSTNQQLGTRFTNVTVPKDATITKAYVEFTVDETGSTYPTDLTVKAQAADNPATYSGTANDITSRTYGSASVAWSATDWTTVGQKKQTSDISALVQEVVNRTGWAPGNALALKFNGTGHVVADSFEGGATVAPKLHVEYSTGTATPTPTPTATVTPTPTATATPTPPGFPTSRSKYTWPFKKESIWNMPIGSGAQYVNSGLQQSGQQWTQPDEEYIGLNPNDPLKNLTSGDEGALGQVRVPGNYAWDGRWNGGAAFLQPDGDHFWQGQPLTLTQGGNPSWNDTFPHIDPVTRQWQSDAWAYSLSQDDGMYGAHGGSHLGTVGGTIRESDLTGTDPIRHALKMNVWGQKYLYDAGCGGFCGGFRWPAATSDDYGSEDNNYGQMNPQLASPNPAMKMGALLALPPTFDVNTLQSAQAKKIAQALKDYGAYIVDDTAGDYYAFGVEYNALDEWQGGDGWYSISPESATVAADLQSVYTQLKVVDNNGPNNVGGGGTPRQPLAPPFSDGATTSPTPTPSTSPTPNPTNQAPTVNAGTDQTVTQPGNAHLVGTASDDGLPAGSTLSTTWSKVSGPGTVTYSPSANDLDTYASFELNKPGTYVFRLTASDGTLSSTDDVTVTVNPDVSPPETLITNQTVTGNQAMFQYHQSEPGPTSKFEYRVDGGAWTVDPSTTATGSATVTASAGTHTFEVRGVDSAGNADPTPASAQFTIAASADPTVVGTSFAQTTTVSTGATVTSPTGTAAGDKIIFNVEEPQGTGGTIGHTGAATPLSAEVNDGSSMGRRVYTYDVPTSGAVSSFTFTATSGNVLTVHAVTVRNAGTVTHIATVGESTVDTTHPVTGTTTANALNLVFAGDRGYVSSGTASCSTFTLDSALNEKADACQASGNTALTSVVGVTPNLVAAGSKTYSATSSLASSYALTTLLQVEPKS